MSVTLSFSVTLVSSGIIFFSGFEKKFIRAIRLIKSLSGLIALPHDFDKNGNINSPTNCNNPIDPVNPNDRVNRVHFIAYILLCAHATELRAARSLAEATKQFES